MNTIKIALLLSALSFTASAQLNTIVQTTLSAAVNNNQSCFNVASATGITAGSFNSGTAGSALYILDPGQQYGELVSVQRVSGTQICVMRAQKAVAHISGAVVLVATAPNWFQYSDPSGSCTTAQTYVTPWVNVQTGRQWLCSSVTGTWAPGWNNELSAVSTTTVASAAGAITPSGPLFTVSGTAAVTGFNIPVGFSYSGGFCVAPTGAFTWTTAGNIGLAGTAVVGRVLCFTWNATSSKFLPSYV